MRSRQLNLNPCQRSWVPFLLMLILASVTSSGSVYIWAHLLTQQWDAYAPGFRSLPQNEAYVESETEFDMNPKENEDAECEIDNKQQIDCVTIRQDEKFLYDSDLDEDANVAVMVPPLDLEALANDSIGPDVKANSKPAQGQTSFNPDDFLMDYGVHDAKRIKTE